MHKDLLGKERPRLLACGKELLVGRHSGLWVLAKVGSALQSLVQLSVQHKSGSCPGNPGDRGFEKYLT